MGFAGIRRLLRFGLGAMMFLGVAGIAYCSEISPPYVIHTQPVDHLRQSTLNVPADSYGLEVLVRPKPASPADIAVIQADPRVQSPPLLFLPPNKNQTWIELDTADYGLADCCSDEFGHIKILYRQWNRANRGRPVARIDFERLLSSGEAGTSYASGGGYVAATAEVRSEENWRVIDDLANLPWRTRSFLYPIRRNLNLPDSGAVYVNEPLHGLSYIQFRPDLVLSGISSIGFALADCVDKPAEVSLRFSDGNHSALLTGLEHELIAATGADSNVVKLGLQSIRSRLNAQDNHPLILTEVSISFETDAGTALQCKPIRSIVGNAASDTDFAVQLPSTIRDLGGGYELMTLDLAPFSNPNNWGSVISRLHMGLVRSKGSAAAQSIEIEGIWPQHGFSAPHIPPLQRACLAAARTFTNILPIKGMKDACLTPSVYVSMDALANGMMSGQLDLFGVQVQPVGGARYLPSPTQDTFKMSMRFSDASDRVLFAFPQLGVSNVQRRVRVDVQMDDRLRLLDGDGHALNSDNSLEVAPGHVIELGVGLADGLVTTDDAYQFRLNGLRDARAADGERHDDNIIWSIESVTDGETVVTDHAEGGDRYCARNGPTTICVPLGGTLSTKSLEIGERLNQPISLAWADPVRIDGHAYLVVGAPSSRSDDILDVELQLEDGSVFGMRVVPGVMKDLGGLSSGIRGLIIRSLSDQARPLSVSDVVLFAALPFDQVLRRKWGLAIRESTKIDLEPDALHAPTPETLTDIGNGFIRYSGSPVRGAPTSWSYPLDMRAADFAAFQFSAAIIPDTCVAVTFQISATWQDGNASGQTTPILVRCVEDGTSDWRVSASRLLSDQVPSTALIKRVNVSLTPSADNLREGRVDFILGASVIKQGLQLRQELIAGPQLLTVSDLNVRWDKQATHQDSLWSTGGWTRVGSVVLTSASRTDQLSRVLVPHDSPLFSTLAVRLVPESDQTSGE